MDGVLADRGRGMRGFPQGRASRCSGLMVGKRILYSLCSLKTVSASSIYLFAHSWQVASTGRGGRFTTYTIPVPESNATVNSSPLLSKAQAVHVITFPIYAAFLE
jgi:hypothetical protein